MRIVSEAMTNAWRAEDKTGDRAPTIRATVQPIQMKWYDYDYENADGGDGKYFELHRTGYYRSLIFGNTAKLREIPNIVSCSWQRSVDQDVAECTLVLDNVRELGIGKEQPEGYGSAFDLPGALSPWGEKHGWNKILVPDRLVRTYEGYGRDMSVMPALDENLEQSGMWLIDSVELTSDGKLTLKMRDIGRQLLDMIVFPPAVPYNSYPMQWSPIETVVDEAWIGSGGGWYKPRGKVLSSNHLYAGMDIPDNGHKYVGKHGGVDGHGASDLLRDGDDKYWLSTGQPHNHTRVWWQVTLNSPKSVAGIKLNGVLGAHQIWICLQDENGEWQGRKFVDKEGPTTEDIDLGMPMKYVRRHMIGNNATTEIFFRKVYPRIKRIRIVVSSLKPIRGQEYPWHASLQGLRYYTGSPLRVSTKQVKKHTKLGNLADWADIIPWLIAWAGWFWPPHSTGDDFVMLDNDTKKTWDYANSADHLALGNVWATTQRSGTAPVAALLPTDYDKQPFADVINSVKEVLGYISFVDERGAYVFRMPNIWKKGNWIYTEGKPRRKARTTNVVTLSEDDVLLDYTTTLDSQDLRERVFVADRSGTYGTVRKGFKPVGPGLMRVAGWTDTYFKSNKEATIAADLIITNMMHGYRSGKATIPGYPAIQVDDQIRIKESITAESYYHYVTGISSNLDMTTGEWTYELTTNWLGANDDTDSWIVKPEKLDIATVRYLDNMP